MKQASELTRRLLGASVFASLVFGAIAAGPVMAQERTIKVWFGRENFIPDDKFATLMRENPDLEVEYEVVRLEDVNSQLILALRSNNAPDLVQIESKFVDQLALGGVLKDASGLVEAFETRFPETHGQLAPIAWQGGSDSTGTVYGVALSASTVYVTYRTDWMEEAGIELPLETTDRVLEASRKLSQLPQGGDRLGMSLMGCCSGPTSEVLRFLAMGGQFVDGVPQIDNEIGVEWINFNQQLMRDGSSHPDTPSWDSGQMRAAFIGERAGMMYEGEHIYVEVAKQVPYETGKWAFERLPTRPGQTEPHVQGGSGFPHVLTVANEDEEAALLVLQYLARPEISKQVAIRYQPSTNTAVSEDPEYLAAKPWATDIAPIAATIELMPIHPTRQIQITDLIQELRDRSIADPTADPAALAKEFQAKFDAAAGL